MPMGRKMALLDYNACHPDACPDGLCPAAAACPSKLLKQEKPFEAPMPEPFACRACGECVRACPHKAVSIVTM
jgi:translation initiation factor RLI1